MSMPKMLRIDALTSECTRLREGFDETRSRTHETFGLGSRTFSRSRKSRFVKFGMDLETSNKEGKVRGVLLSARCHRREEKRGNRRRPRGRTVVGAVNGLG